MEAMKLNDLEYRGLGRIGTLRVNDLKLKGG